MLLIHFYIFLITTQYQYAHDNAINVNETAVEQNFILQKTSWLSVNEIISLTRCCFNWYNFTAEFYNRRLSLKIRTVGMA